MPSGQSAGRVARRNDTWSSPAQRSRARASAASATSSESSRSHRGASRAVSTPIEQPSSSAWPNPHRAVAPAYRHTWPARTGWSRNATGRAFGIEPVEYRSTPAFPGHRVSRKHSKGCSNTDSRAAGSRKPLRVVVDQRGILRGVQPDRVALACQVAGDIQAEAANRRFRLERRFGCDQPAPDRIGEQPQPQHLRDRACHLLHRHVVAMRVEQPGGQQGVAAMVSRQVLDRPAGPGEALSVVRCRGIAQAQEADIGRRKSKPGDGCPRLVLAQRPPPLGGPHARVRMRTGAVGHHQHERRPVARAELGDQAAAAERLVVGVGAEDHRAAAMQQRVVRGKRQGADLRMQVGGPDRHAGGLAGGEPGGRLGQGLVWRRLAQVGGEVAHHPLRRIVAQEGGQAEAALHQPHHVQPGLLCGDAGQVDQGRDVAGIVRAGLGDACGACRPHGGGLARDQCGADAGALMRVVVASALVQLAAEQRHQPIDPAQCHRDAAPGAGGEFRLAQIVARTADQRLRSHADIGEIARAGAGGAHAVHAARREAGAAVGTQRHDQHAFAAVRVQRGEQRPGDVQGTGGEPLLAGESPARAGAEQAQRHRTPGHPDAEQMAGCRVLGGGGDLRAAAIDRDQLDGVDVAFIEPPDREAAPSEPAQYAEQGQRASGSVPRPAPPSARGSGAIMAPISRSRSNACRGKPPSRSSSMASLSISSIEDSSWPSSVSGDGDKR